MDKTRVATFLCRLVQGHLAAYILQNLHKESNVVRTVRDSKLDSRSARAKLAASGVPYYRAIDPGLHIGYRKGKTGGKWVVRWYAGDGSYKVETIGTADDTADADAVAGLDYAQAQEVARTKRV